MPVHYVAFVRDKLLKKLLIKNTMQDPAPELASFSETLFLKAA